MKKLQIKKGFTLIELLVVIAIIAILASILIPVVTSALDDAKTANMRDTGIGIYKSIFAADADDPVFGGQLPVWPSTIELDDGDDAGGDEDDGGGESNSMWNKSSTSYFKYLVRNDFIESDFALFAGPGLPKAKSTNEDDFSEQNNGWCVTLNVLNKSASLPFLFSSNLNITELPDGEAEQGSLLDLVKQNEDTSGAVRQLNFHEKAVVVVTKGGQGFIIKKKAFDGTNTVKNFNPTEDQNPVMTPTTAGTADGGDGE